MDRIGAGVGVPTAPFADLFPLRFCADKGDRGQVGATVERIVTDALDAVGDGDRGQPGAVEERTLSDARDAVGDGDRSQPGAVVEGPAKNIPARDGDRPERRGDIESRTCV